MRARQYRIDREPYEITENMLDQYSTVKLNQQERLNELYDITKNYFGLIQRIGVDTVSISKKHYEIDDIFQIGDYTQDNYIVTKVEIVYSRTFVIARYELSKNFNRIAQVYSSR